MPSKRQRGSSGSGSSATVGTWEFEERGNWSAFDPAANAIVESSFAASAASAESSFVNGRTGKVTKYKYDLQQYQQINQETGYTRTIRRNVAAPAVAVPPAAAPARHHAAAGSPARGMDRIVYTIAALKASSKGLSFKEVTQWVEAKGADIAAGDACCICQCDFENDPAAPDPFIRFGQCLGHHFHLSCVDNTSLFQGGFVKCPVCSTTYGQIQGTQPDGVMTVTRSHARQGSLPGYDKAGMISITYTFGNGMQVEGMPSPGRPYSGTSRIAYLPDNAEGAEIANLLAEAFRRGLVFQVGDSVTNGSKNTTVWNGIHHKTNMHGGSSHYGYPDDTYLSRVKEELAAKGVM
mmetsp:Transcript_22195/g.53249  ORF Transcript_22195/g.53249 Transcript_22195/m.53249 type:complete len:350 (+) Transcript_22195:81-1130(+)